MSDKKEIKKKTDKTSKDKNFIKPGEIQGKIEITDIRNRKDGPGGN